MKPKSMLVVISLVLSVVIGLVISKGGAKDVEKKASGKLKIGLSMDTLKEARWQKDRDIFVAKAESLGAVVNVQSAESDDTAQIQGVRTLLSDKIDVLVIIPHNGQAMAEAVKECEKAGVPVIAYDRLVTDCNLDLYLSFDNVRVGEMQAKWLVENLNGKGKIVRIYGAPTDNNAKLFKKGQDNILQPYIDRGEIEVLHEDWAADWDPARAKKIMNAAIIGKGTGFDAVLASNDGTAGGAIQSLKENGLAGKVLVTGQDADLVACQRIVSGMQSMTIYKPVKRLAERAAELAVLIGKGKPVIANGSVANGYKDVPSVLMEVIAVDSKNMREVVIADDFHKESEIYASE